MFLHLVDDEKFTDGSAWLFESCDPGNHRYVIISKDEISQFRYIKKTKVEIILRDSPAYNALLGSLSKCTGVFVYSLFNRYHLEIVNKSPADATLVWFFGGGELLTTKKNWPSMMLPRTRILYYKHRMLAWVNTNLKKYGTLLRQGGGDALLQPFRRSRKAVQGNTFETADFNLEKAIARFNYIAPVIPEDYERLKTMASCNAEMVAWSYATEFPLETMKDWQITGRNWLVGNAARYALNHIEMFRILRGVKGHQGDLITPLSYGDSELYTEDVLLAGKKCFGRRFRPVLSYMPIEQYHALIGTCSAAFFNTLRQHAMGNVLGLIYLGSRVYLRDENPAYRYLKRHGAAVFSIQTDIPHHADAIDIPLDEESIRKNRAVVMQLASQRTFLKKTDTMLTILKAKAPQSAQ